MVVDDRAAATRRARSLFGPHASRRFLLAAKTAAAATLAWFLAPFVPLADTDYSYYAPLGVLISMYPTVWDSARTGLQFLLGLACGIPLGLAAIGLMHLGAPGVVALAFTVTAGVVLGVLNVFGDGRDWIAISGLFVLLVGGIDAGEYSLSYLVTTAFGVVVGVAVQLLTVPPFYFGDAEAKVDELQESLSECLTYAARAWGAGEEEREDLRTSLETLVEVTADAASEIQHAQRSEHADPRSRFRRTQRRDVDGQFARLDRAVLHTRLICDLIEQGADQGGPSPFNGEPLVRTQSTVADEPIIDEPITEIYRASIAASLDRINAELSD